MKVYLAGKITGDPNYKAKFARAAAEIERNGSDIALNPADNAEGLRASDYARLSFSMIDTADLVAFLPDWIESRGANIEHELCIYIGKPITYLKDI